jgi:hypothetical protein
LGLDPVFDAEGITSGMSAERIEALEGLLDRVSRNRATVGARLMLPFEAYATPAAHEVGGAASLVKQAPPPAAPQDDDAPPHDDPPHVATKPQIAVLEPRPTPPRADVPAAVEAAPETKAMIPDASIPDASIPDASIPDDAIPDDSASLDVSEESPEIDAAEVVLDVDEVELLAAEAALAVDDDELPPPTDHDVPLTQQPREPETRRAASEVTTISTTDVELIEEPPSEREAVTQPKPKLEPLTEPRPELTAIEPVTQQRPDVEGHRVPSRPPLPPVTAPDNRIADPSTAQSAVTDASAPAGKTQISIDAPSSPTPAPVIAAAANAGNKPIGPKIVQPPPLEAKDVGEFIGELDESSLVTFGEVIDAALSLELV